MAAWRTRQGSGLVPATLQLGHSSTSLDRTEPQPKAVCQALPRLAEACERALEARFRFLSSPLVTRHARSAAPPQAAALHVPMGGDVRGGWGAARSPAGSLRVFLLRVRLCQLVRFPRAPGRGVTPCLPARPHPTLGALLRHAQDAAGGYATLRAAFGRRALRFSFLWPRACADRRTCASPRGPCTGLYGTPVLDYRIPVTRRWAARRARVSTRSAATRAVASRVSRESTSTGRCT